MYGDIACSIVSPMSARSRYRRQGLHQILVGTPRQLRHWRPFGLIGGAVMDNNAVVIEVLFNRFGLTVDDLAWGDTRVDAVHYAKIWQSFNAMLVLIDKFQLPGFAEIRRAWQERAVFINNPYCWWMEHGSDFFRLFINEAVRTFGPDVDQ